MATLVEIKSPFGCFVTPMKHLTSTMACVRNPPSSLYMFPYLNNCIFSCSFHRLSPLLPPFQLIQHIFVAVVIPLAGGLPISAIAFSRTNLFANLYHLLIRFVLQYKFAKDSVPCPFRRMTPMTILSEDRTFAIQAYWLY